MQKLMSTSLLWLACALLPGAASQAAAGWQPRMFRVPMVAHGTAQDVFRATIPLNNQDATEWLHGAPTSTRPYLPGTGLSGAIPDRCARLTAQGRHAEALRCQQDRLRPWTTGDCARIPAYVDPDGAVFAYGRRHCFERNGAPLDLKLFRSKDGQPFFQDLTLPSRDGLVWDPDRR